MICKVVEEFVDTLPRCAQQHGHQYQPITYIDESGNAMYSQFRYKCLIIPELTVYINQRETKNRLYFCYMYKKCL